MSILNDISNSIANAVKAIKKFFSPTPPSPVAPCPATGFATRDEAARDALTKANPLSIRDNLEYSGLIYQGSNGRYYYSGPVQGAATGANPWRDAPMPPGNREVAYYHTHAAYSVRGPDGNAVRTDDPARDDYNSDNFSSTDRRAAANLARTNPGYVGYVGTPSGTFKMHNPATGLDTVL